MIVKNFSPASGKRNALLINPPVYNCSGFKLEYSQPTGLLRIASLLQSSGASVTTVDCLESPVRGPVTSWSRRDGTLIPKYHFGTSFDELEQRLLSLNLVPDEVYITSFATYWYESTRDTIALLKKLFPSARTIVGGIYPTLVPEHAERVLGADLVVVGEVAKAADQPIDLDCYDQPKYLGIKPSRGCPHDCAYCAQRRINRDTMAFQDPNRVCDEIQHWYMTKDVGQVYIFSENFLVNRCHFTEILTQLIERGLDVHLAAPKGMESRLLDRGLIALMKEAGWRGIRLALETVDPQTRQRMARLHNDKDEYENAIANALDVGYEPTEIGTFLLYGLPEERLEKVVETAEYIHSFGGYIIPMAFTPVPGSQLFDRYSSFLSTKDLADLCGNLYPFAEYNDYRVEDYLTIEKLFAKLNRANAEESNCHIDLLNMETRYAGIYARSEMATAMAI
jgi:radical SAM superfamily enzyme YgiQ (UPF0313 family)